jgi:hypothetical protein
MLDMYLALKKRLLSAQMDLHGYTTLFGGGLWKLKKASMIIVKGLSTVYLPKPCFICTP